MSSLEKISVQGIRSFGTDDHRQVITFFSPLTLILGPNGSGKTTIIESLKYITTGEMPPNCGRGGSFVHDPKIANRSEVKGQVRLQFRNTQGKRMIVARSIVATQKANKVETRTLEGQIVTRGADGEQISLSAKCADMDREMITSLGVSKAVLNNVIFCHQEDSNWPLSEGKTLKTKFDEIFAATKYIKALENIKKLRSELMGEARVHKTEAHHFLNNKEKAEQLTEELSSCEVRLKSSIDRMNEIKTKLEPIEEKLTMIGSKEREIQNTEIEMKNAETLIKKMEKDIEALRRKIGNSYVAGSAEKLKRDIETFQSQAESKNDQLREVTRSMSQLEKECGQLRDEKSKHFREIGRLETLEQAHRKQLRDRDSKVGALALDQDMAGYRLHGEGSFQDDIVNMFLREVQDRIRTLESDYRNKKSLNDQEVEQIQRNVDELRNHISRCQQTISMNTDRKTKNMELVRNIVQELATVDGGVAKQKAIEDEIIELQEQLKMAEGSLDLVAQKEKVQEMQQERGDLEKQLNVLDSTMTSMQLEGQKRSEVDILVKDKTSKEEMVRKLFNQNEDNLKQIFGNIPENSLQSDLENRSRDLAKEMDTMSRSVQNLKSKLSALETKKKFCMDHIKEKEEELNVNNEKIFAACGSDDLDETLNVLETTIAELQDDKGSLIGCKSLYEKYLKKLGGTTPCCPLCQRGFNEDHEVKELSKFLEKQLVTIPDQLKSKDRVISEKQSQRTSMIEIRPLHEKICSLEKELPELKGKLKSLNTEIDGCKKSIMETEGKIDSTKIKQGLVSNVQPDVVRMEQARTEMSKLESKIKNLKVQLGESGDSRTLKDVGREKDEIQKRLNTMRKEIEELQEKGSRHSDTLQSIRDEINKQTTQLLDLQKGQQQRVSKEQQRKKLNTEIDELDESNQKSKDQLKIFESDLRHKLDKKNQVIGKGDEDLAVVNKKLTKLQAEKSTIDAYCQEIAKYIRGGNKSDLKMHQDQLKDIIAKLEEKELESQDIAQKIESLREEIANQKVREGELHDNLKLKEDERELDGHQRKFSEARDKLGSIGLKNFYAEKLRLIDQEAKLGQERQVIVGRKGEQQAQVARLKRELDSDMFKDATRKYTNQMIVLKTTELAADDLNKYYVALDTAVMKYHATKMEEINQIVRDLWSKTYRGNDIDFIEIRSDEEATTTSTEKKRTYNYRVVMIKGDAALDMRGRCSAGQKVLASLIIRLALAETFCLNCGVLALDEPTTNLDRENIESMSNALLEIVHARSVQRNFQLVVITHDEDFIEALSRSDTVEYYYKVHKNAEALSRITKSAVGEMP